MTNSSHLRPSWEQLNAAQITRRVNAHDELVAALKQIESSANIVANLPTCGERPTLEGIARLAHRALATVEG